MTPSIPLTPARPLFALIFLASALALGGALTGQYMFDLAPCVLCLYQRIPFVLTGLVAALMVALPTSPKLRRLALLLCALAFIGNTGLAFYHVGVEQHWWASPACTGEAPANLSISDLQSALQQQARPACDEVQWSLFGITMAGYNLLYSLGLSAFCLFILSTKPQREKSV